MNDKNVSNCQPLAAHWGKDRHDKHRVGTERLGTDRHVVYTDVLQTYMVQTDGLGTRQTWYSVESSHTSLH